MVGPAGRGRGSTLPAWMTQGVTSLDPKSIQKCHLEREHDDKHVSKSAVQNSLQIPYENGGSYQLKINIL